MAKRPDTPCSGGCGRLLWSGGTSLPAGVRCCRECRRSGRAPIPVTRTPTVQRNCAVDGCERKHLANGFCKVHYHRDRKARGIEDSSRRTYTVTLVGALAKRYNDHGEFIEDAWNTRIRAAHPLAYCPLCGNTMPTVPNDLGLHLRDCTDCHLRVSVNPDEYAATARPW